MEKKYIRYGIALFTLFAVMLGAMPFAQADPIECKILSFKFLFNSKFKHAQIDDDAGVITIVAPDGMDLRSEKLVPYIDIPTSVLVDPPPRVPQDFSQLVTYTATLWNRGKAVATKQYYVRVIDGSKELHHGISAFSINGVEGYINEFNKTILVELPGSANLQMLTPQLAHNGVSCVPAPGETVDFTTPVLYTVSFENGSTEQYTVYVQLLV